MIYSLTKLVAFFGNIIDYYHSPIKENAFILNAICSYFTIGLRAANNVTTPRTFSSSRPLPVGQKFGVAPMDLIKP